MAKTEIAHLYLMVNGSLPGLVKIGVTSDDPNVRAKQLSASSGVPTPYVCAYSRLVRDPFTVEVLIHRALDDKRVNDSREFFKMPVHEAITALERFDEVEEWVLNQVQTPFAELFKTFQYEGAPDDLTEAECAAIQRLRDELGVEEQTVRLPRRETA